MTIRPSTSGVCWRTPNGARQPLCSAPFAEQSRLDALVGRQEVNPRKGLDENLNPKQLNSCISRAMFFLPSNNANWIVCYHEHHMCKTTPV
jgi:hypothetical protein